jgi:uncharacterized tellurite resistance protein B-like protein
MLDRVLDFLTGRDAPAIDESADELQLAVATLLVEAARMDSEFDAAERAAIEDVLEKRFHLSAGDVRALIGAAERAVERSTQFFPFTRQIAQRMSPEGKAQVIEMLWTVAYADGVLDPHEDMLVRRIAGLIHVPDHERGLARRRALDALAAKKKAR